MKTPKVYIIVLVVMFTFLLLSSFRAWILVAFAMFAAITLGRYFIFRRGMEED